VQLHGHEAPSEVRWNPRAHPFVIKAFNVGDYGWERDGDEYDAADALLVDAAEPGSGETFDWAAVAGLSRGSRQERVILAGGLSAANVGAAIEQGQPVGRRTSSRGSSRHRATRTPARCGGFIEAAKSYEGPEFDGDQFIMPFDYEYIETVDPSTNAAYDPVDLGLDEDIDSDLDTPTPSRCSKP